MNTLTYRAPRKFHCPAKTAKKIIMTLVVMGGSFFSYAALASCTVGGAIDRLLTNAPTWNIQVDGSAPINTFLYHLSLSSSAPDTSATCIGGPLEVTVNSDFPVIGSWNGNYIYDTGIPGIGMVIHFVNAYSSGNTPFVGNLPILVEQGYITGDTAYIKSSAQYIISLIKIGDIYTDGYISPSTTLLRGNISTHGDFNYFNVRLANPVNVKILRPTCSVDRPNFTVVLGNVSVSNFNASGRTTPINFTIDLTCAGGTSTSNVHVTLTDASNPGNTSTQLNLSPDSGAQGIVFEVHNKFGIVSFGPDLSGTGNPGQWLDGAAGVGSYSIPLSVNYVRLPGPIKGGTANSGVTYTLNYD